MDVLRHRCLCPFHDDGRPSLTFNTRSNRYRCFVCDARGSNIDLVMKSQGWTFRQACTWMASQFGLVMSHEMTTSQMLQAKALYRPAPKHTSPGLPTTDTEYLEGLMRTPVLSNLLFLGLVASTGGFLVWNRVMKVLGAVRVTNYVYFQSLLTMTVGAVVLHERVTWMALLGCMVLIGGMLVALNSGKKAKAAQATT